MNLRTLQTMPVRDVVRGNKLSEAVERVSQDGARLVLTRYGMPVAAVVPLGDLELLTARRNPRKANTR
jgi:prevent-host-death family protein